MYHIFDINYTIIIINTNIGPINDSLDYYLHPRIIYTILATHKIVNQQAMGQ